MFFSLIIASVVMFCLEGLYVCTFSKNISQLSFRISSNISCTNIMHALYINYQLDALTIIYSQNITLHVSSIKCSSSGGHRCIQAAYGTVTLYKSPGGLSIRSYRENSGILSCHLLFLCWRKSVLDVWPCMFYWNIQLHCFYTTLIWSSYAMPNKYITTRTSN